MSTEKRPKFVDIKNTATALESMLNNLNGINIADSEALSKTLPQIQKSSPLAYDELKDSSDDQADATIDAIVLMYLPKEFIISQSYIIQKVKLDKLVLSSFIFQNATSEHAIKKLLEQIDEGIVRDRTFEVLGSLQKSKIEILKHMSSFMIVMENNYKALRNDYMLDETVNTKEITDSTSISEEEPEEISSKFKGSKDLLNLIKQGIKEKEEENETNNIEDNGYKEI